MIWGEVTVKHVCHSSGTQSPQELREGFMEDKTMLMSADSSSSSTSILHLRWQIQRKVICIPKSVTPSRILQNIQVLGDGS